MIYDIYIRYYIWYVIRLEIQDLNLKLSGSVELWRIDSKTVESCDRAICDHIERFLFESYIKKSWNQKFLNESFLSGYVRTAIILGIILGVWISSVERWIVEKCNSIFNGITGNMETNVEAVHLGRFEMLQPQEKTSVELFIGTKLLEVKELYFIVSWKSIIV